RAELGYPIMVTPLSQFVGSQAAINVIVGERYKEVTDQIIQYALGYWGKEGAELMAPEVKAKILDRPRAREWAAWQPPEPSVAELRKKMNAEHVSDEEFLLRWNLNVEEIEAMRAAGAPKEYLTSQQPLVSLIDALSKRKDYRQIVIQKGDLQVAFLDDDLAVILAFTQRIDEAHQRLLGSQVFLWRAGGAHGFYLLDVQIPAQQEFFVGNVLGIHFFAQLGHARLGRLPRGPFSGARPVEDFRLHFRRHQLGAFLAPVAERVLNDLIGHFLVTLADDDVDRGLAADELRQRGDHDRITQFGA